jgi:SAM-dependent methyltransferase
MIPLDWPVLGEASKTFLRRLGNGFFRRYMAGPVILDVGYKGGEPNAVPIFPHAIGIDLGYPGYDGIHLPFADGSVDTVFSSHVLEHLPEHRTVIRDWFRVLKPHGYIVCIVPHQFLYERKAAMPSHWSPEHLRFYTPGSLLREFEDALRPNTYRIRHLSDGDSGFDYETNTPDRPAAGCYEIEFVLEKIPPPPWTLL